MAAIEWNLELLKASAGITRTPLRTLKSMVQASVVVPTRNMLREIVDSPSSLREKLGKVYTQRPEAFRYTF